MLRTVVFHYNNQVRERVVDACRHAGFITYDAVDPWHAFTATWTYRPNVVITDFPALLDDKAGARTLTEAIRQAPALQDTAILNLSGDGSADAAMLAAQAGASATMPPSTSPAEIIAKVNELSRRNGAAP
jgi:DNA-binding response OmpR family regulator